MTLTIVFLACRFDRPTAMFRAALDMLAKGKPDVIVLTEVAATRHRVALRAWATVNGYAVHQGPPGPTGECAVLVRWTHAMGFKPTEVRALTRLNVGDRGRVWTLEVRIGGLLLVVGHLPRRRYLRAARQAGKALKRRPSSPGEIVAVLMDFNRNQKSALGYRWLHRHMPGLTSAWRKPYPKRGTHSGRLIDGLWTNAEIVKPSRLLGLHAASDHEAFTTTIRVRACTSSDG
ncbi:endonuclease/exonuclease/phosphatase family protein [Nocardioides sp. InS609-2]|uniref:endonuclease/exonuclease/phosphatase family protein n=1 Tax=Nocardioides sp. InS609-2 TaxID=2760705 RepID=UPI0020C07F9B|nr:endonuclease/exonuclease/phosphatase family protein [Nocardioides sp. InS609-2]